MKILVFVSFFLVLSTQAKSQSFELMSATTDTVNKISSQNYKEGIWVVRGKHQRKSGYAPDKVIETGNYLYNRKAGVWYEYYPNGKPRSKITYVHGALDGPATFYDTNGNAIQEGSFKANKWVK